MSAGAANAKSIHPAASARRRQPVRPFPVDYTTPCRCLPFRTNTLCPPGLPPQWPRDAVLARHLLAQAQAKLRNRDAGRRTAVGWEQGRVLPWGGLLPAPAGMDVNMLKVCRSDAPGLAGCAASKPAPQRLPAQGAAAAAAAPPPPPDTKATPYVMSTEELRRKNKEVGGSRASAGIQTEHWFGGDSSVLCAKALRARRCVATCMPCRPTHSTPFLIAAGL